MFFNLPISPLDAIADHPGKTAGIKLFVKRDDLLHPEIQGNKWRKLAPVIAEVRESFPAGIVTFGGPYSNHLHAVAVAGRIFGIPVTGIVRGNHADPDNATLRHARQNGMTLYPVSKQIYDACKNGGDDWIGREFPGRYILPEGGSTRIAVESCAAISREIVSQLQQYQHFTSSEKDLYICVPAGTGCTAAGIVAGLEEQNGQVLIFPVVNRDFNIQTIRQLLDDRQTAPPTASGSRFRILYDYESGGFARLYPPVLDFVHSFHKHSGILLDPVYTAKMMFGVYDQLGKGVFPPGSTVVAVHTGGLQGWQGFQERWGAGP